MKQIKFTRPLSKQVLAGTKTTTWRLFDDKDLKEGDNLEFLISDTKEKFAEAIITNVSIKAFKNLTQEDWEGHEKFTSNHEMYQTYSGYYKTEVNENTLVKVIRFKVI